MTAVRTPRSENPHSAVGVFAFPVGFPWMGRPQF